MSSQRILVVLLVAIAVGCQTNTDPPTPVPADISFFQSHLTSTDDGTTNGKHQIRYTIDESFDDAYKQLSPELTKEGWKTPGPSVSTDGSVAVFSNGQKKIVLSYIDANATVRLGYSEPAP